MKPSRLNNTSGTNKRGVMQQLVLCAGCYGCRGIAVNIEDHIFSWRCERCGHEMTVELRDRRKVRYGRFITDSDVWTPVVL